MEYKTTNECREWVRKEKQFYNISDKYLKSFLHYLDLADKQSEVSVEALVKPANADIIKMIDEKLDGIGAFDPPIDSWDKGYDLGYTDALTQLKKRLSV